MGMRSDAAIATSHKNTLKKSDEKKFIVFIFRGVFNRRIYYRAIMFNRKSKQPLREMAAKYIHQTVFTSQFQKDASKILPINLFFQQQMQQEQTNSKFTRHEKCLMWVRFERCYLHYRDNDGRSISRYIYTCSWRVNVLYYIMNNEQTNKNIFTQINHSQQMQLQEQENSMYWYLLQQCHCTIRKLFDKCVAEENDDGKNYFVTNSSIMPKQAPKKQVMSAKISLRR